MNTGAPPKEPALATNSYTATAALENPYEQECPVAKPEVFPVLDILFENRLTIFTLFFSFVIRCLILFWRGQLSV